MRTRNVVLGIVTLVAGLLAGCSLFTPVSTDPVQAQQQQQAVAQQSQQLTDTANTITSLIAQLKTLKQSSPTTATSTTSPAATTRAADPAAAVADLLTTQLQNLNTQLQAAPNVDAQKQAAFAAGVQTAQAAAVTFGGQYGALIAAGLGIVSVLIQGMVNSSKAHQTAQSAQAVAGQMAIAAHETAAAAVGAIAGSARFATGPDNVAAAKPG